MEKTIKNKYFEFTSGWCNPSLVYHVAGYHDPKPMLQIYLFWGKLFIYLPWYHYEKVERKRTLKEQRCDKIKSLSDPNYKYKKRYKKMKYYDCESPSYGVYYYMKQIGIHWGKKTKLYDTPWAFDWVRTSSMMKDGTWEHEIKGDRKEFWDDNKWGDKRFQETHPYKYIKNDGTVQETTATIRVDEREWRLRYFKWFKLIRTVRRSIDVKFKDQLGERVGSYKGGTTGTGHDMLKGETPYQTLKRMEKNIRFR